MHLSDSQKPDNPSTQATPSLPPGWIWTTIGKIANTTRIRVSPVEFPDLPFVGMEHVEAHTTRVLATVPAGQMRSSAEYFRPGDVLYGRLRPYLNKVFLADFTGLCSGEFIPFRRSDSIDSRYLLYFLNSWQFVSFASHLNEGDRPRVDFDQLAPCPFPLPPLPEQHRIVATIETHFTRLDAGVAALQRVQANLRRYRASVLKAACEGKLVSTEAELAHSEGRDYEPAAVLLERILVERRAKWVQENPKKKYVEPAGPDVSGLPELPEGWCYVYLGSILQLSGGMKTGPFGSLLKKHEHRSTGVPVVGIENIRAMRFVKGSKIHITPEKARHLSEYRLVAGDIVLSRSGTVGEVCVVPQGIEQGVMSTNVMRIRLDPEAMLPQFFCVLFNGSPLVLSQVSDLCSGSTRDFLSQSILSAIGFPLPPLAEQVRLVAELERYLSLIEMQQQVLETSLGRSDRLRQSILRRAFLGRLAS